MPAQLIRRRLIRLAELTAEIREVAAIINAAVAEVTTGLTGLHGLGPVGAATILGEVADVRRYRSRHGFAAANGRPAPGLRVRQRHKGRVFTAEANCATGAQSQACSSLRPVHRTHRRPRRYARPALTHRSACRFGKAGASDAR